MKENIRIVFMGTPDFAVASLKAVLEGGYEVVGVITSPDRPAGRGRKIRMSAVKEFSLDRGLNILQPANLKDPDFLDELRSLQADLQIVVAFRMLPEAVWKMPKLGTFNLHASLLPEYRGAAPINWAIINGESRTGVTTFFINHEIDKGALILQREVHIGDTESAGELHDKLMNIGSELVVETVRLIQSGKAHGTEQPTLEFKPAPKLNKENCRIDWKMPMDKVYNHIRGLSPYPAAWTLLEHHGHQTECKIYKTTRLEAAHEEEAGKIRTSKKEIRVAVKGGYLRIESLQLSGKRKMDAVSFLNGYQFETGDRFI
jgi:methionyl-tRNA formyltransferase